MELKPLPQTTIEGKTYSKGQAGIIELDFIPHKAQQIIKTAFDNHRYVICVAGRRFGKSELACHLCLLEGLKAPDRTIFYCAPTYRQCKEIAFNILKRQIPRSLLKKINETELKFHLINGSCIKLLGTEQKDNLLGQKVHFATLDESALIMRDREVWHQIIRPMLIDTKGKVFFIGTPRGYNPFYELWNKAEHDPEWARFHFTTKDNTAVDGIQEETDKAYADALTDFDKLTCDQELGAQFMLLTGRIRFDVKSLEKLAKETREGRKEGSLYVYEPRAPRIHYTLGVDTSEGLISGDYSSVVIVNNHTFSVDAVYYGKHDVDVLAGLVDEWARLYNDALVVVEDNNHGLAVLNTLKKTYWNLYHRKQFDERTNTWTKKVGFRTTVRTKPLLVATIDKCLKEGFKVPDRRMVEELSTYIIDDDGKTCAQEGCHDDTVMALGCALQGYTESTKKDDFVEEEVLPRYCYTRLKRRYEVKEERLSPLSLNG